MKTPLILAFTLGAAAAGFVSGGGLEAKKLSGRGLYEASSNGVLLIETEGKSGSGFLCDPNLAVTCSHVVEGQKSITVKFSNGVAIEGCTVAAIDLAADIAILKLPRPVSTRALHLQPDPWMGKDQVKQGDHIFVIGAPEGLGWSITDGLISNTEFYNSATSIFNITWQISAPISHGSSGSPIFDDYGDVIGMVNSSYKEGQLINFGVSTKSIVDLLKRYKAK